MAAHGTTTRQPRPDSLRSAANDDPGLFGRMFDLPPLEAGDDALLALARTMHDGGQRGQPNPPAGDSAIPAGFTYLGQFIDHDITFDTTSLAEQIDDPEGLQNFRSPALDLDSVYGLGPAGSPHLYERDPATLKIGAKLLLGHAAASPRRIPPQGPPTDFVPELKGHDLPRNPATGVALIGDPRNDENLLVAQTHVAFMRLHNAVVDLLRSRNVPEPQLFDKARAMVTHHYQWLVLHEFLDTITGRPGIAEEIMARGRQFYRFRRRPFMPVEYAVAAYRFGHSMVREVYAHNAVFGPQADTIAPATLGLLFDFTAKSGRIVGALQPASQGPDPLPQPVLPSNWVIDWRRFFDFGTPADTPGFVFNHARRIDPLLTATLHTLPGEVGNAGMLAFRNLKRGVMMRLPSGQDVARRMGLQPLSQQQLGQGADGQMLVQVGLGVNTPLWYYVLKEAQLLGNNGQCLGPVGATLVAEVMVGLVQGSRKASYLSGGTFSPDPALCRRPGRFGMADLLTFAGVVNPVG
jgi:hypothetical protein